MHIDFGRSFPLRSSDPLSFLALLIQISQFSNFLFNFPLFYAPNLPEPIQSIIKMARSRSSSSRCRYFNPAYYLKRPRRMALLLIIFVSGTLFFWDRQTLIREHEVILGLFSFSFSFSIPQFLFRVSLMLETLVCWLVSFAICLFWNNFVESTILSICFLLFIYL